MKSCPNCASLIADDALFCQYCGQRLAPPQPPASPNWDEDPPEEKDEHTQPMHHQAAAYPAHSPPPDQAQIEQPYQSYPYTPPPPLPDPPPAAPSPSWWSNNTYRVLLIVLAVMFICACSLAVLSLWSAATGGADRVIGQMSEFFGGAPVAEATATPTETSLPPTPTPWPTFTPLPTYTSMPTYTPLPTFTPIPTEPPAPEAPPQVEATPTDDEPIQLLSPACSAALERLEQISAEFTRSPTVIFDAEWRAEINQALEEMRTACGSLESASPVPGQVAEVQRLLSLSSQAYDEANRLLNEGIAERNPGKMWNAVQQFTQAARYLSEALAGLREIGR